MKVQSSLQQIESGNGGILPMSKAAQKLTDSLIDRYKDVIQFDASKRFFSSSENSSETDESMLPEVVPVQY